jgi:hypothetical protein
MKERAWAVKDETTQGIMADSISIDRPTAVEWAIKEASERRRIGLPQANFSIVSVEVREVDEPAHD